MIKFIFIFIFIAVIIIVGCVTVNNRTTSKRQVYIVNNKKVKIILPKECYTVFELSYDDLPGIGSFNASLKDFKHKEVFPWNCSIVISFENTVNNGMPSLDEQVIVDKFEDYLNENIANVNNTPVNGIFLGRLTYNSTREINWRIHNPEIVDRFLKLVMDTKEFPREFDYKIEQDPEWELVEWYFGE